MSTYFFPFSQQAVMRLITGWNERVPNFAEQPAHLSGFETDATLLWADGKVDSYPWLDMTLRRLIGRMMVRNYKDCPLLEDILDTASQAVRTRTEKDYPGYEQDESDEGITAFVKRLFFEAPTGNPDPSDSNPSDSI